MGRYKGHHEEVEFSTGEASGLPSVFTDFKDTEASLPRSSAGSAKRIAFEIRRKIYKRWLSTRQGFPFLVRKTNGGKEIYTETRMVRGRRDIIFNSNIA